MDEMRTDFRQIEAGRRPAIIAALTLASVALHLLLPFVVHADAAVFGVRMDVLPLLQCLPSGVSSSSSSC